MGSGVLSVTGGWPWESGRARGGLRVGGWCSSPLLDLLLNRELIEL